MGSPTLSKHRTTAQSEFAKLTRVALKHARDAFRSQADLENQWRALGYTSCPNFATAVAEYDELTDLLDELGVRAEFIDDTSAVGADSIYVRDAAFVCARGIVLCNMGKAARCDEPVAIGHSLTHLGYPIIGAIAGDGCLEGGDVVWLDERTLIVGRGYRSNREGIDQLRGLVEGCVDEFVEVALPHWHGPDDVFHLMSMFSPVDDDLAVVYAPLLPVPFRELLLARGMQLIEVGPEEFQTLGCNVLAVAPRRCIMLDGNPAVRRELERAGAEVFPIKADEICQKGCGGPTCLTRPLERIRD